MVAQLTQQEIRVLTKMVKRLGPGPVSKATLHQAFVEARKIAKQKASIDSRATRANRSRKPSLVDLIANSPLRGSNLEFDRDPDLGRDVDL